MNENQILDLIAETLEMDSIEITMALDERIWDSLAVVVFIVVH